MKQDFIRAKELAGQWDITPRRVNQLCADGMIPGAYKAGRFWMIPSDFGMLAILSDRYYTLSNRESGEGRFDLQLEPRDHKRKGYIIEFKVAKSQTEQELAGAAKDAVRQIRDRGYAEGMKYHGITEIGFFGIAFHGKRVACEYQEN